MPNNNDEERRRRELATFLRTQRERKQPDEVGLSTRNRRRTPGLRREEVAQLAGISVDWYTRLEQGRDIRVSDQVLDSIAHVLDLSNAERKHLYMLAFGHQPPPLTEHVEFVGPTLQLFLNQQGAMPAVVTGYRWDILAWNASASWLYGCFEDIPDDDRNIIWLTFTDPYNQQMLVDWESHAKRLLAQFRASYGKYIRDERFNHLVERLRNTSSIFADWWDHYHVLDRQDSYKEMNHPDVGLLKFKQMGLHSTEQPELKIVVYLPVPESGTLERIESFLENRATTPHQNGTRVK